MGEKNLTDEDAKLIQELLDGWPLTERITWDAIIEKIKIHRYGKSWSRQALSSHNDILRAYRIKKALQKAHCLSPVSEEVKDLSPELRTALATIAKLESENQRLAVENQQLKEQFMRWAHNAHMHNMTEGMLNTPMIDPDRGATKKVEVRGK